MSAASRANKAPGIAEILFGAFLSAVLGVVVGAALLASKPVQKVKEIPKDAPNGAVFYIEGTQDFNKGFDVAAKRKAFVDGQSVALDEGELNAFITSSAPKAADADPKAKGAPAPGAKPVVPGVPNVRIKAGKIQVANTVTFSLFGFSADLIVQANGAFSRHDSQFGFDPETFYVGGCPIQRLPFVRDWALHKLLFVLPIPDDLAASWSKLDDVTIDGSTLRLKTRQG